MKHSEVGQKHLIRTITHSWRVGEKIMKQSKEVLNKLPRRKEGRNFFSAIIVTRKIDSGLPALVVALCSNRSKCSDRNGMPCKRSWSAFPVVWVLFFTIPSATSEPRTTAFCALIFKKLWWWILMFLATVILLLHELHRNYLFKLVLSSARSNTHMMDPLCERITNLFCFNSSG